MDNCKQNQLSSPRTALVPDAISAVLHWTENVNERLTELSNRLSPVLRNEPMPADEPDTRRTSCNVSMANDINEAASRANLAAERIEDILRRLEL